MRLCAHLALRFLAVTVGIMHFAVGTKTSYETKMFLCPKRLPKNPCVFAELPLFRFSLAISLYEQIFPELKLWRTQQKGFRKRILKLHRRFQIPNGN